MFKLSAITISEIWPIFKLQEIQKLRMPVTIATPNSLSSKNTSVKIKVALEVFRHAESKSAYLFWANSVHYGGLGFTLPVSEIRQVFG